MSGVEAVGWVVAPLVAKLLDECFASLGINAKKKLQELRGTVLPLLKSVIEEAEGGPRRSEAEGRLQRLKDAYGDGEDVLDLLDYYRLRRKVRRHSSHVPRLVRCVIPILEGGLDMLSPQKIKLRRSLSRLGKIESEAEKLRAELGSQRGTAAGPESTSEPPWKVFGRDEEREEIIRVLKKEPAAAIREPGKSSIPTIAVVGRPGVGKTALAQSVHEQLGNESGDGRFYPIMWVYASRNFTASDIMKDIIQQASLASGCQDLGDLHSREALQRKMKETLNAKRFLLVIDDVWCDGETQENNWKTLKCLGKCRSPGSKILVTSQTEDAPRKIGAAIGATIEHILHLGELEENDFSDLFIHHALSGVEIDSCLRGEFEKKCTTIAKKLNKDPKAAETVGKTIAMEIARLPCSQGNQRAYLDRVADDWSGDKTEALMWSYRHLPAHLQRCFSYCSLYPKGYSFEALELVQLWMAQGFIQPDDQNKRLEDAGNDYLNELVSRFYIQRHDVVCRSFGTDKLDSYYTLHELLYDLVEKVTRNYCVRIEGNNHQCEIPSTVRHLWIAANKLNEKKEKICKLTKLRTLIVTKGESVTSEENVATDIFRSLKKLRVLVLELYQENFAKFISEMKHLRVLQVSSTSEFVLPKSVCTLYQLQVLRIESASFLPKFLNNLVRLRYLEAKFDEILAIPNICKLTSLQCLEKFPVSKEKGNELEQLQNLNELREGLCIANLENVKSKKSAIAANLKDKKHLRMIQLVWSDGEDSVDSNLDAEILEGLQLPPKVTTLHLEGYRGRSCPSWPESQASNIEELALRRCGMLEELPPMDRLYPSCTSLELSHLSRLKVLQTLPPELTTLMIGNTPFLTFVTNEDLQMSPAKKKSIREVMRNRAREWFPGKYQESLVNNEKEMMNFIAAMSDSNNNEASSAEHNKSVPATADVDTTAVWERWLEMQERKMELIYSRQNEARLLLPSTLTKLSLEGCNITNRALSACLQTLTSLTFLSLADIKTITRLPSMVALAKLKALQTLHLRDCWAVTSLGIGALPNLRNLRLIGCPCLDSDTASVPSSLQSILFESCADVDVILANAGLPNLSHLMITQCHMRTASLQFGNLQSLHSLSIRQCPGLSLLAKVQNLHSLKFLDVQDCPNLQAVMNLPKSVKILGMCRPISMLSEYSYMPCPYPYNYVGYENNSDPCSVM